MKILTLLSLSFILSVFSANAAPSSVLDVTGKNLRAGVNYYVKPAAGNSSGGGIAPGPTGPHKTCPLGITQLDAKKYGLPLTFAPVNPKKRVIRLSTDANIKFSGPTSCNESNVWRLKYDEARKSGKRHWIIGLRSIKPKMVISLFSALLYATSVRFYAGM